MSSTNVEYVLSLKDLLTSKIKEAEGATHKLDGSISGLQNKLTHLGKELIGSLGIGFAAFKGFQTVEEGVHKVHELHAAEAQLENTMKNMGNYSEEAFEKAVKGAGEMAKGILFSKKDIIEMQSQLGLVGSIGEKEMNRLTEVAADMSTKFGMGLSDAGNMLAKAINNPEIARRLGMTLRIDPAVMEHVQKLAKDGKEAEARMLLLSEAEQKVGGAAKAAFAADPLAGFNKGMNSVKMAVGEAAIELQKSLAPALMIVAGFVKDTAEGIKSLTHWVQENKKGIEALAIGIGVAAVAYGIYSAWSAIAALSTEGLGVQVGMLIAEIFTLENVMTFGIPIAVAAITAAIAYCWLKFAGFRAVIIGVWEVIKEFVTVVIDYFKGLWSVMHGIFTLNPSEIKEGFSKSASAMMDAGSRMASAFRKGYNMTMAEAAKETKKEGEHSGSQPDPNKPKKTIPTGEPVTTKDISPKGASGTKVTTINVSIGKLIEQFKIQTTNMTEGSGKVKELVAQTLLSALNDSQITAGI